MKMTWSDLRIWWRRLWARWRWRQFPHNGRAGNEWARYNRRVWCQRRERGNVALFCGQRRGRFNATN